MKIMMKVTTMTKAVCRGSIMVTISDFPVARVGVRVRTIILRGLIVALDLSKFLSLCGSTSVPARLNIKAMTGCILIE